MTRLTTIFTTLYALYSLPLISAWTFVWRNASDNPTVEKGTGAQSCKAINHAKGKEFNLCLWSTLLKLGFWLIGFTACCQLSFPDRREIGMLASRPKAAKILASF